MPNGQPVNADHPISYEVRADHMESEAITVCEARTTRSSSEFEQDWPSAQERLLVRT